MDVENYIMKNNIKLLILDCDGTLMDTVESHYLAWRDTYNKLGHEFVTFNEFQKQYAGTSGFELVGILNHKFNYTLEIEKTVKLKDDIFITDYIQSVRPFENVLNLVKQSYGIIPMVVASGGETAVVNEMLNLNKISKYFVDIITINDVKQGKPFPDLFLEASARFNVFPHECLIFEDSNAGFQAAKNANMKCIDVNELGNIKNKKKLK